MQNMKAMLDVIVKLLISMSIYVQLTLPDRKEVHKNSWRWLVANLCSIWIPDEASNGALGVNSVNLFCCKQNVLDLIMELFFMLVKY